MFFVSLQLRLVKSFCTAGVTAEGSPTVVAAAELLGVADALAFGVALVPPLACAEGEGVAASWRMYALVLALGLGDAFEAAGFVLVAVGLGVGVAAGAAEEPSSSTGRNRSSAVALTSLITCCEPAPGTVTVMSVEPSRCTDTPVLPDEFTRLVMIATACVMSLAGGGLPFCVTAWSVASVPLERSSPRPILKSLCHFPGLNAFAPTMPMSMTTISATRNAIARLGFEPLFLGGATCPVVPQSIPARSPERDTVVRRLLRGRRAYSLEAVLSGVTPGAEEPLAVVVSRWPLMVRSSPWLRGVSCSAPPVPCSADRSSSCSAVASSSCSAVASSSYSAVTSSSY